MDRKKTKGSEKEERRKNKITEVKPFPVPFALGEIKTNITINTNTRSKPSKEQIIDQAFRFHSQGNTLEAAKYYQYFIDQGFNEPRVYSNYGAISQGQGKSKKAEVLYRKAIEIKPDFADAHYNLANLLQAIGKLQEAEVLYRKAIEIKPDYTDAHLNLGNLLKDISKLQEAELSYRKSIEIKPDYAQAHLNLGIILRDLGKLEEAELYTRKAIEINSDSPDNYLILGSILELNNKLKEAKNSFTKAQLLKPDLDMYMGFASLYLKEKKPQNALILIDKFLEKNQSDTRALAYKTIALRGVNKFDEFNKLINFPKLVKKIYSQNLIKEDIFEFNKKFRNSLLVDPRRKTEENQIGWAIRGGTVIRALFEDMSNPFISQFHRMLSQAIEIYIKDLPVDFDHPFLRKQIDQASIDNCWVNFLEPGDFQSNHIHNNGWLSGVYYLDEPKVEKNKSNAGWIEFNRSGYKLPHFGGEKEIKLIKPKVGMFILFPSYLWHGTIPYKAAYTRGSISFDITIK
ncbi:tetratricopeptide repeat protein [Prochlorococcus marinus]|uniref:tetratricopeptide repeat protein n=1 Tax=Prochlorococcus marinus TaxID=1219 RepID=UPI0022B4BDE3|nr:tetratricopeptide repeat protein [Prochlorococcus marinus]